MELLTDGLKAASRIQDCGLRDALYDRQQRRMRSRKHASDPEEDEDTTGAEEQVTHVLDKLA